MATLSRGQSFGATETVTNTKLHNLVDNATITNIVDADIAVGANIQFSKLLASSIDGSLFTNLSNIPSAAGKVPFANLNVPFGSTYVSLVSIPNLSLLPLTLASWVDGAALRNLASTPVDQLVRYNLLVSSLASGAVPSYNGANNFVGRDISSATADAVNIPETTQALTLNDVYTDITNLALTVVLAKTSNVIIKASVGGWKDNTANELRWSLFRDSTLLYTGASHAGTAFLTGLQDFGVKDANLVAGTYVYKIKLKSVDGGLRNYTNWGNIAAVII